MKLPCFNGLECYYIIPVFRSPIGYRGFHAKILIPSPKLFWVKILKQKLNQIAGIGVDEPRKPRDRPLKFVFQHWTLA